MRWNEQLVVPIIRTEYMENMRPHSRAELVHDFALPFPVRVIYAILGFPPDRESIERFAGWALRILAGPQKDPEKAKAAMQNAFEAARNSTTMSAPSWNAGVPKAPWATT